MSKKIISNLETIEQLIESEGIPQEANEVTEWRGADVVIQEYLDPDTEKWLEGQPVVISFQRTEARRRAVITKHSQELSWLFLQLRNLFADRIDHISKYDFYGLLAQSAIDYLENNEDTADATGLLHAVLKTAKVFCEDATTE